MPGQIVEKEDGIGLVDVRGNRMRAGLALVPEAGVGDWVLLHAGFAITQISSHDAAETNALLDEMERLSEPPADLSRRSPEGEDGSGRMRSQAQNARWRGT